MMVWLNWRCQPLLLGFLIWQMVAHTFGIQATLLLVMVLGVMIGMITGLLVAPPRGLVALAKLNIVGVVKMDRYLPTSVAGVFVKHRFEVQHVPQLGNLRLLSEANGRCWLQSHDSDGWQTLMESV